MAYIITNQVMANIITNQVMAYIITNQVMAYIITNQVMAYTITQSQSYKWCLLIFYSGVNMKKYEQRLVCGNQYNVSMKSLKIFKSNKK
jgi:hypothetical protein